MLLGPSPRPRFPRFPSLRWTYGPYINSILLNLVHYFLPVYYGDVKLYKPKVGATREPFETRCTITLQSNLLLRVPFQASTSGSNDEN